MGSSASTPVADIEGETEKYALVQVDGLIADGEVREGEDISKKPVDESTVRIRTIFECSKATFAGKKTTEMIRLVSPDLKAQHYSIEYSHVYSVAQKAVIITPSKTEDSSDMPCYLMTFKGSQTFGGTFSIHTLKNPGDVPSDDNMTMTMNAFDQVGVLCENDSAIANFKVSGTPGSSITLKTEVATGKDMIFVMALIVGAQL